MSYQTLSSLALGAPRARRRMVRDAERRAPRYNTGVVPLCREQVRDALPQILTLASTPRSREPIEARGMAGLQALLFDGTGPCYTNVAPEALRRALTEVSRWLSSRD